MPTMLRLLGTLGFERNRSSEPVVLDRPVSLLTYLAVRRTWVPRTELAFLYRPDEPEAVALRYLRKLVFRARSVPWAEGLEVTEAALRWIVDTDLHRFRLAMAEGAYAQALALYDGPFLGGASLGAAHGFGAWQEGQRNEVERHWIEAARGEADRLARAARHAEAATVLERLLERDPLDEEVVQAAMSSLAAAGRRREALRVYEAFGRAIADEVDGTPVEATAALADAIRRAASPSVPTAPTAPTTTGERFRLPNPPTGFVGREQELATVTERLTSEPSRLVTLVGLGGSGKTRLALEAANRVQEHFADGAGHVSLAGMTSPDRVAGAIVERLGLPWTGGAAEEALASGLADRRLLLLLDEFEGVVDAAPLLVRLLERAPRLVILVTSREALEVRGEHIVDVSGLEVPPEGAADAERYDAVRLFAGCAARVAPGFSVTPANRIAIAEICRDLEGLPLAIEMAASWIRTLRAEDLRSELRTNGRILTTRLRDVPERQSSLLRVFDYSCARLPPEAREALPRLTVFRGGFTLEAAQAVAGVDLIALMALMNRTLVRVRADGRYAMHALVRQYALLGGARPESEDAHARYFAGLLARLAPDLRGRDPAGALARIDADLANIEAAWERAVAKADLDLLDDGRDALDHYWHYHGRWHAAAAAFSRAVAACERQEATRPQSARLRARLLVHLAAYERALGSVGKARARAAEAVSVLTGEGSASDLAHARLELASCAYAASAYEEASALYEAVLDAGSITEDRYLQGAAHNGLANVICAVRGDMEAAEAHYRTSLRAHSAIGNLEGINGALVNLGACRYDRRDFEEAGRLWTQAADIARRLGYAQREAVLHNNLGSLAESTGDLEGAAEHYERSLSLRREIGDRRGMANVLRNMGHLAHAQERFTDARGRFAEALVLHDLLDEPGEQAQVRSSLARTLATLGRGKEAEEASAEALRLALLGRARADMLAALVTRGELRERAGDAAGALRLALYVVAEAQGREEVVRERAAALARRAEGSLLPGRAREIRDDVPVRDLADVVAEEAANRFDADRAATAPRTTVPSPARPGPVPRNADGTRGR